jgi:hypothetical protein
VKKAFIGALASLMLAGAISAASGATANTTTGMIVIVGESSAPIPQVPSPAIEPGEGTSIAK